MLEAIRSIETEDVTAGLTRVSDDHPLARRYPGHFRKATDGPPDGGGGRAASTQRARLPLEQELQVRAARIAEISATNPRQVESESGRRQRIFWSGSQALLDSMMDPRDRERAWKELREDAEHDETVSDLGRLAREELEIDRIDQDWHWN